MKVFAVTPRGYCLGVVNAIQTVKQLARESKGEPLYLLGMLVHNQYVVEAFHQLGVQTIPRDLLMDVLKTSPKGKVILSAHGSSNQLKNLITSHGFSVVDTVCKDVVHNMELVRNELMLGHDVLFLGKHGHPEAEATLAIDPNKIHLIETISDVVQLRLTDESPFLTNQTTLSLFDVYALHKEVLTLFPRTRVSMDLCKATTQRQEAVLKLPKDVELVIVVGDTKSNNSNMLVKIAKEQGKQALLIHTIDDLVSDYLRQYSYVAVTSGASTPPYITNQVINWLSQLDWDNSETLVKPIFELSKVI